MQRLGYVVRRVLQAIPLLLVITALTFALLKITPGDPARAVAGIRASDEVVEDVREDLGLNDSVVTQYTTYLGKVIKGDLGTSQKSRVPVTTLVKDNYAPTLWILGAGIAFTILISVPLAIAAALRPDSLLDRLIGVFSMIALSLPMFWVGIVLLITIALRTDVVPIGGYGDGLGGHIRSMVLPGLTMAIGIAPLLVRSLRAAMIEVLDSDYVAAARAAGVTGWRFVRRFVIRNALVPAITLLAVQIGFMLFGVVVIENTFDIGGLGRQMIIAAASRDFPTIQGLTLVFAVGVVLVHLVADILVSIIDPRVELQ